MTVEKVKEQVFEKLSDLWSFNWPVMDVLINGSSSIDLDSLAIRDFDDASEFLKSYGYDPSVETDRRQIHAVMVESLRFIEKKLMPKEWARGNRPPDEVLHCIDARQLLLWASHHQQCPRSYQNWACAILRLMHTIAHIEGVHRTADFEIARQQIIGRFEKALFRDVDGKLWLGDKTHCIQVERIEWKNFKTRESIVLKLLHKPGNVAETIYDLLGVRIITKSRRDVMLAVHFLRRFYLVTFPNINPSRVRNNLIDYQSFREVLDRQTSKLEAGEITAEEFHKALEEVPVPVTRGQSKTNPHSSNNYRSVQLTCRQLIRYPDPSYSWQDKFENYIKHKKPSKEVEAHLKEFLCLAKKWHGRGGSNEVSIFFPFEVQIIDSQSKRMTEVGEASHDLYKKAQIRTARRRILGRILNLAPYSQKRSQ